MIPIFHMFCYKISGFILLLYRSLLLLQTLRDENKLLNRTVKRQELELERLLGAQGELPTILQAHNQEVRVLKAKLKKAGTQKSSCVPRKY